MTDNPHPQFVYPQKHIFKQYLDDWLVSFKNRKEIFSKTGKKVISQQTCKEPYIYDIHMEVGCPHGMRGYKFCHMSVDGVGSHKIGHFLWLSKMYDP